MDRSYFITYLQDCCNCEIVRNDSSGYSIVRNLENKLQSGIPKNDPLKLVTVCRICKTLMVDAPGDAISAMAIINIAHDNHEKGLR